jgi:hypothetical protein
MTMSITDQLVHTTVRIECQAGDGRNSSGTGFIMSFCHDGHQFVPAIVTNKHVIDGAAAGVFHMTLRGNDNLPLYGQRVPIRVRNFESLWVKHPHEEVDLAAFPLAAVLRRLEDQGKHVFYFWWDTDFIANAAYTTGLNAVEDILMIGCPNGLWDSHNNLPIVRRGVTATPPYIDFEGRPEFIIDCACFPGSSGSPILLYNPDSHSTKNVMHMGKSRIKLLGILWGAPQYTAEGEIRVVPAPVSVQPVAVSRLPINLGFCVKADQLLWFESHFEELEAAQKKGLWGQN